MHEQNYNLLIRLNRNGDNFSDTKTLSRQLEQSCILHAVNFRSGIVVFCMLHGSSSLQRVAVMPFYLHMH